MSNNPGKRGKPAPWVKRANDHRANALQLYRRANHHAYDKWCARRSDAAHQFRAEEDARYPERWQISKAMKASDKRLLQWEKENPNPLSWDDYLRLEAEFDKEYR